MSYSIKDAAERTGIPATTIRYYDKQGLLPHLKKNNGIRIFEEIDLRLLTLLNCLKHTGMSLRRIKQYVELTLAGDSTLRERYKLIKEQRQFVLDQIEQLQFYLAELDFKDWYYTKALKEGSEKNINFNDYEKETGKASPEKHILD